MEAQFTSFQAASLCSEEHWHQAESALKQAYAAKRRLILKSMAQRGMLLHLGQPPDLEVQQTLDSLEDLMPQYSRRQLHACLRHFGYDLERCTHALMEPMREMPLDLRVLMRVEEDDLGMEEGESVGYGAGTIPYFHDGENESLSGEESDEDGEREGLSTPTEHQQPQPAAFSLEPDKSMAAESTTAEIDAATQAKVAKLKEKYGDLFDMSELLILQETMEKANASKGPPQPMAFAGLSEEERMKLKQRTGDYDDSEGDEGEGEIENSDSDDDVEASRKVLPPRKPPPPDPLLDKSANRSLGRGKHAWIEEKERREAEEAEAEEAGGGPSKPRIMEPSKVRGARQPHPRPTPAAASSKEAGPSTRERQLKERNKGKAHQRGADKKARGGMF